MKKGISGHVETAMSQISMSNQVIMIRIFGFHLKVDVIVFHVLPHISFIL